MKLGDWLDERRIARSGAALDEPVRAARAATSSARRCSARAAGADRRAAGQLLLAVDDDAWASVAYLQQEVTLGWFIRGLHSAGASAMVVLLGLHLLQVTMWGAYRSRASSTGARPGADGAGAGFALTGYLLPWDQKGYWATQVATSLARRDAARRCLR